MGCRLQIEMCRQDGDGTGKIPAEPARCQSEDGMGQKDSDGHGWERLDRQDAGCRDANSQMGWTAKMGWRSGGRDGNREMGVGVSPQHATTEHFYHFCLKVRQCYPGDLNLAAAPHPAIYPVCTLLRPGIESRQLRGKGKAKRWGRGGGGIWASMTFQTGTASTACDRWQLESSGEERLRGKEADQEDSRSTLALCNRPEERCRRHAVAES